MKANTVLSRILLLFLALVIPWSLLSVFFLRTANKEISSATSKAIEQSRTAAISSFEEQIIDTFTAAGLSDTLERSVKLAAFNQIQTKFESAQSVNQIQESLTLVKTLSPFVSNAAVYIEPLDVAYNAAGYSEGIAKKITAQEFSEIRSHFTNSLSLNIINNEVTMLLGNSKSDPTCIMKIDLSSQQMLSTLVSNLEFPSKSLCTLQIFGEKEDVFLQNYSNQSLYTAAVAAVQKAPNQALTVFSFEKEKYYIFAYTSTQLNFTYLELIPYSLVIGPVELSTWLTLLFSALTVLVVVLFFRQAVHLIHKPLKNLIAAFDALRHGDFSTRATASETIDFAYLYDSFNRMAEKISHLVTQNYQQKILLQNAELRQLQAQINPHFLYNSFFLLQRIIDSGDIEQSSDMAHALGIYFRYITKQNNDRVPLMDEIEHAEIYANIQAARFSGRITVYFGFCPEEAQTMMVPKLFLQPLIENAFKYGLEDKLQDGYLQGAFQFSSGRDLFISIEDNGDGLSDEKLAEMQEEIETLFLREDVDNLSGMFNIAKRLFITYENRNCFGVRRSKLGGLAINICIPSAGTQGGGAISCIE